MTGTLSEILDLMRDLASDAVRPAEFVHRYMPLWKALASDQRDAIARQPAIEAAIGDLRERLARNEIRAVEYQAAVDAQYELLEDVALRPGCDLDRMLGHLFVESDAYVDGAEDPADHGMSADDVVSGDDLRELVLRILAAVDEDPSAAAVGSDACWAQPDEHSTVARRPRPSP